MDSWLLSYQLQEYTWLTTSAQVDRRDQEGHAGAADGRRPTVAPDRRRLRGARRALLAEAEADAAPEELTVRGKVQKRVFGVPSMFTERGMSAGEVARELDYDEPNAYTVLDGLVKAGHVEHVPNATPRRYRMTLKHRRDRILRLSRL